MNSMQVEVNLLRVN